MEEEDFSKLSIEDRCQHKVWKARLSGYEAAANLFKQIDDDKSPEWNKYTSLVKKFVIDSNAPAQEKGLEAVLAFVENCGIAGRTVGDVMAGLVSKCISAPKAKTKEIASQIALMYIEIEKHEAVLDELLKGTESKNPKILAASIHIINQAIKEFGAKVINVGKILKRLPKLLEDRDNNVRAEAKLLLVEIYCWLGPAIKPHLATLKPVQLSEVEAEFDKVKEFHPKPKRLLRSQQIKKEAEIGIADGEDDEYVVAAAGVNVVDPYDLLDPVDILSQLPKTFYTLIEAKKWAERKDALESLEKILAAAPKIENADYGDLVRALKKIIAKDSNIVVVGVAIKCVAGLAKGLKKKFCNFAISVISCLFEKFKEKKQNVVLALREAVDAVFLTTSLELILDDTIAYLDHKNPNVKAEVIAFLSRCFLRSTPAILNKKLLKPLAKSLLKCLADQDPAVRDNTAQALGVAMKAVGEKNITPFLVDVDNQKMQKIKECCDKTEMLVKVTKAPAPKPSSVDEKKVQKAVVKPRAPAGATGTMVIKKRISNASMQKEDALDKARTLMGSSLVNGLLDVDLNTKLESYTNLLQNLKSYKPNEETSQIVFYTIHSIPSDRNEAVCNIRLQIFKFVAETMPIPEEIISLIIMEVASLLQSENSELANEALWALSNNSSIEYVARALLSNSNIENDPNLWSGILNWFSSAIMKTEAVSNSAFIVECGRKALGHNNITVRNAGLALIGTIHLKEVDTTPNENSNKPIKNQPYSEPKHTVQHQETSGDGKLDKESNSNEPQVKVDVGLQITEQLILELGDKNWKIRAEAVNKVQSIVNCAQCILPNLGEAPPAIAARIVDSNSKIAASAISLVESLAKAMGPQCKHQLRVFLPLLIKSIGDPKAWIRSPAISCLDTWGEIGGYKEFFEGEVIADALKTGSPTLRSELWCWLGDKLPNVPPRTLPKEELTACIATLYTNLEDRNADVRKNACDAVYGFMIHLGFNNMMSLCENMKFSNGGVAVKSILEKTRGNLPEKSVQKSKPQGSPEKTKAPLTKMIPGSSATITKSKPKGNAYPKPGSARKKEEDVDINPLLQVNNLKNQRMIDEQKLKTLKWNFTTPRSEFIELLRDQMIAANVNKSLIANMFHADFKCHLRAIDSLAEDLPSNKAALIGNLDLILRWMTIRFFDTNPSVLLKGLEYLTSVFTVLIEEEYNILDAEASAFFPYLILKAGDPKDTVRNSVRALFKLIGAVFPLTKQFNYLMEGVKSKNARQRSECLEQLGWLIDNYGLGVCHPTPAVALKEVAKFIADRDITVRNAAINLVVSAYFIEGDKVLKMVSQISDKDFSLLEERIKRANKNRPVASVKPLQPMPIVHTEPSQDREILECDESFVEPPVYEIEHRRPEPSSPEYEENATFSIHESSIDSESNGFFRDHLNDTIIISHNDSFGETHEIAMSTVRETYVASVTLVIPDDHGIPNPYDLDQHVIEEIECTPETTQVPKLADIDLQFLQGPSTQATITPIQMPKMTPTLSNFTQPTAIKWELSQIGSSDIEKAMASIIQIDTVLNSEKRNRLSGFVDYMVNQLVQQLVILNQSAHPDVVNCYRANFSLLMKLSTYQNLCGEITEGSLYKVIEQLLLLLTERRLDTLEKHEMFSRVVNALTLKILENSSRTNMVCALIKLLYNSTNNPEVNSHFRDLVVKSLWKLHRTQHEWDQELDYGRVLLEFHAFLKDFPTAWWKAQDADVPLRTVKTILHTMVRLRGAAVRDIIKKFPCIAPDSELATYVRKLIRHLKVDEGFPPSLPQNTSIHRVSKEVQDEVSEIFKMIGDRTDTEKGLRKLYMFQKSHPESDLQPFLVNTTPAFRDYIKNGLANLEAQHQNLNLSINKESYSLGEDNIQDNSQSSNNKPFIKEVERLWNRLHLMQEKTGSQVEKRVEAKENSQEKETIGNESKPEIYDSNLQSLKERMELIKTNFA